MALRSASVTCTRRRASSAASSTCAHVQGMSQPCQHGSGMTYWEVTLGGSLAIWALEGARSWHIAKVPRELCIVFAELVILKSIPAFRYIQNLKRPRSWIC